MPSEAPQISLEQEIQNQRIELARSTAAIMAAMCPRCLPGFEQLHVDSYPEAMLSRHQTQKTCQ